MAAFVGLSRAVFTTVVRSQIPTNTVSTPCFTIELIAFYKILATFGRDF